MIYRCKVRSKLTTSKSGLITLNIHYKTTRILPWIWMITMGRLIMIGVICFSRWWP